MKESIVNKSWQDWVDENLARGCNPSELAGILAKNNFKRDQILMMMGGKLPEGFGGPPPAVSEGIPTVQSTQESAGAFERKAASLFAIRRELARLNPKPVAIERRQGVLGSEFLEKYYSANWPVIFGDLMTYWQALKKWTPEYLLRLCGKESIDTLDALLPPFASSADEEAGRKRMTLSAFLNGMQGGGKAVGRYTASGNNFFSQPETGAALKDIELFTEYLKDSGNAGISLIVVPGGVNTALEQAPDNILMAQVTSPVRVKVLPASELECVYNAYSVYGRANPHAPDYDAHPHFQNATLYEIELKPGEVLFIPAGWWYAVSADNTSIAVTFTNFLYPNHYRWAHPGV